MEEKTDAVGKSSSVIGFLKKVLTEELGGYDDDISYHKLLTVAFHAVLLESGFVAFDMKSKTEIQKRSPFQNNWPSNSCEFSLFYTVPGVIELILPVPRYEDAVIELKFHFNGSLLNVFGSRVFWPPKHSISLDIPELAPFFKIVWSNFSFEDEIRVSTTRVISKFWKGTKDKFANPLLTDLCNKVGLQPPTCFSMLSDDLKLKILRLLPQKDAARMRCVSKEFLLLARNDRFKKQMIKIEEKSGGKLWKQKYAGYLMDNRGLDDQSRSKLGFTSKKGVHPYKKIDSSRRFPRNLRIDGVAPVIYFRWPRHDPRKNCSFF